MTAGNDMTILREGVLIIEIVLLVICAIIMIIKKVRLSKLLLHLSFGLYLAIIIAVCFFPVHIGGIAQDAANNFIPFKSIADSIRDSVSTHTPYGFVSVFGNFVMLMPLGIFFHFYVKNFKGRLLGIFLFSAAIEAIQFIIGLIIGYNYRSMDIDDVLLNTLGGIIFYSIFYFAAKKVKKGQRNVHTDNH